MRLVIQVIRGGRLGQRWELQQDLVRLGRRQDNDVPMDPSADRKTSGNHAEIERQGEGYILRDLGSTNGTLLNGKALSSARTAPWSMFGWSTRHS